MAWPMIAMAAATALSAGAGAYGSGQASDAQSDAAKKNRQLYERMFGTSLAMIEPNRALQYGAVSDIGSLYGWAVPRYTPLSQLMAGGYGPIKVGGGGKGGGGGGGMDIFGYGPSALPAGQTAEYLLGMGGGDKPYTGTIDPTSGTVQIAGGHGKKEDLLTQYLRTGEWTGGKGGRMQGFRDAIDRLRAGGWEYDPNAATAQQAGPTGEAGNFSRFFTSPDYTFRRDEGTRNIGNTWAGRGIGGDALRELDRYNSGLAAGEFDSYVNRLMRIAGIDTNPTTAATNAATNYSVGSSQANTAAGDARASGVLGAFNSGANAINSGLQNWLLYRGGYFNAPAGG